MDEIDNGPQPKVKGTRDCVSDEQRVREPPNISKLKAMETTHPSHLQTRRRYSNNCAIFSTKTSLSRTRSPNFDRMKEFLEV